MRASQVTEQELLLWRDHERGVEMLGTRSQVEEFIKTLRKPPQSLVQRFFAFFQWWS